MIRCPSCGQHEFVGTLYCSECGVRLTQQVPAHAGAAVGNGAPAETEAPEAQLASGARAGLKVPTTGEVISLIGRKQFTLGRSVPGQAVIPDIDLERLDASLHGVSRMHAELIVGQGQVVIKDLESVNGTIVNGKRLRPQRSVPISNGDLIEIGSLRLQLITRQQD
jgi:pSer/pThr/pTyr-binding forkhead associated (FHA) protein